MPYAHGSIGRSSAIGVVACVVALGVSAPFRHKKKLAIAGISGVGVYQDSRVKRTTLVAHRD